MSSKKKSKHQHSLSAPDLIKLAQDQLQRGQAQTALESLQNAEVKLKQATTAPPGKKLSIPPHLTAALNALPALFARALFMRSFMATDAKQQIADLEEAAKRDPGNHRLVIARGASRLLKNEPEAAYADFQKADEMQPGDALATRAFTLGLLGTGREQEANALLERTPPDERDAKWRQLAALSKYPLDGESRNSPLLAGLVHLIKGEKKLAAEKLSALPFLDHNPSRGEAAELATQFFYNGALNFSEQRHQAALGEFSEALRLAESHQIHLPWRRHLSTYLHKMAESAVPENLAFALQCWQQALRLLPDDKVAQANLSTANSVWGQLAWREGKTQDAIDHWLEALKANPDDERVLKSLALAFEKLDRNADALTHW